MIENYFFLLLNNSILMSLVILLLLLLSPALFKKYSAKWRYYSWLIVIMGLAVPFRPHLANAPVQIEIPMPTFFNVDVNNTSSVALNSVLPGDSSDMFQWRTSLTLIWALGALSYILNFVIKHRNFVKMTGRWSADINDDSIKSLMHKTQNDLNIHSYISLKACKFTATPMMTGFFKPSILLPQNAFHDDELEFIFKHELIHYKRMDLWYKSLVLLVTAIHWFNPFVYMMARAISIDCEASCDEAALHGSDLESRKLYGKTIINIIVNRPNMTTALSTQFNSGIGGMKKRICMIMDMTNKKTGIAMISLAATVTLSTGFVSAGGIRHNASMPISLYGINNEANRSYFFSDLNAFSGDVYNDNDLDNEIESFTTAVQNAVMSDDSWIGAAVELVSKEYNEKRKITEASIKLYGAPIYTDESTDDASEAYLAVVTLTLEDRANYEVCMLYPDKSLRSISYFIN